MTSQKSLSILELSLTQKKSLAHSLKVKFPLKTICSFLSLPRSTFYYQPLPMEELSLKSAIEEVSREFPTYGYRRVTEQLKRKGFKVNHKRISRILKEMGLNKPVKKRKCKTTNSNHSFPRYPNLVKHLKIFKPDQVWVSDLTYIRLEKEFIYLAVIMDVFTRAIRGWELSKSLDQSLSLGALEKAFKKGKPKYHHSDQGVQYAAEEYIKRLKAKKVKISMAPVGCPEENGYAERLMRTIKEEEVDLTEYKDYQEAYQEIGRFLEDVYMKKRIHSSLGYMTPEEFETEYKKKKNKRNAKASWHKG